MLRNFALSLALLCGTSSPLLAGINAPIEVSQTISTKPQVLIYYTNEPLDDQYARIVEWLDANPSAAGEKLASRLKADAAQFGPAVDAETTSIRSSAAGRFGYAIFTNRLAARGSFEYGTAGERPKNARFAITEFADRALALNPLAHQSTLARALEQVASVFDPALYDFVLVTKSHGNEKFAMTSLYLAKTTSQSAEELVQKMALATAMVATKPVGLVAEENETLSPENNDTLAAVLGETAGLVKSEYVDTLRDAGKRQHMRFSLVYVEACNSIFTDEQITTLPENIGTLYTSDKAGLRYRTIDYIALAADHRSLATLLSEALETARRNIK